ncbi:Uncharacterised protein [uncultured archaeon]|nr:Uncharacterised protein [uncultured archaeon]
MKAQESDYLGILPHDKEDRSSFELVYKIIDRESQYKEHKTKMEQILSSVEEFEELYASEPKVTLNELYQVSKPVFDEMDMDISKIKFKEGPCGFLCSGSAYSNEVTISKLGLTNLTESLHNVAHEVGHIVTKDGDGIFKRKVTKEASAIRFSDEFIDAFNKYYGTAIRPMRFEEYGDNVTSWRRIMPYVEASKKSLLMPVEIKKDYRVSSM